MKSLTLAQLQEQRALVDERSLLQRLCDFTGLDRHASLVAMCRLIGLPVLDAAAIERKLPRLDLVSITEARRFGCMAVSDADIHQEAALPMVLLTDPLDPVARRWLHVRLAGRYIAACALPEDIEALLERHERQHKAMDQIALGADGELPGSEDVALEISLLTLAAETNPVIKFVNSTLYDALAARASDIHFESSPQGMQVKYRIDGVLQRAGQASGHQMAEQIVSRIKVLAELDISERRVPQDGRFGVLVNQREVDFRVSIMPSIHGEDAVLRILDRQSLLQVWKELSLEVLGLDADAVASIRRLAREPYGLLLVTGPTGSGKSTTLYGALSEINTGDEKIITIEDPVEYQLPGVLQIPVNDRKGLTFARGLRSILRHDPDKILVGEIRDAETALIAVQAAQTGHLVLASIHANSVLAVLDRFGQMGLPGGTVVEATIGVVAQRLIRRNCPHCCFPTMPDRATREASQLKAAGIAQWRFRAGRGCDACRGSGYLGRIAIAEVLRLSPAWRQAYNERRPPAALLALAREEGFRSLREAALGAVARGETTLQEANRVTFVD
nr:GspE/PulE family protein [uncultured Roseateles sp.]